MFPATNMAFTAYIFQEDYDRLITQELSHASQQQRGGSLFGQWTSTGNPVIHRALSFSQSQGDRDVVAKSLYEGFRVCPIGEWRPVQAQTRDMQAREARESLIRGREPPTRFLVLDVSRTEIVPFLLNRQTAQHERGRLEKLPGENPFNKSASFEQRVPRRDFDYPVVQYPAVRYPAGQPNLPHQTSRAAQFQEAITADVQWYSGEEGNKKLQKVVQDIKEIALGNVDMSRDTKTQDISLSFTASRRAKKWEIRFPSKFPGVGALLIENPGTRQEKEQRQATSDTVSKAVKNMISRIQKSSFI
ncbi:uncharacterized protein LOC110043523 [Orbicella faveolata]|uniref:uncharacterized protein LOC110043523 n=1 Tax=Orbicella faveolata TaxID=48498 RepID=UPI0009E2BDEB|nr:uncharacterized protein LOC110043523 [Orbicella faveolata]